MDQAPEGEPVELIWADSPAEQAKRDRVGGPPDAVQRRPRAGRYGQSSFHGTRALSPSYVPRWKRWIIPFTAVITKEDKKTFDRTTNTVKIITPHSAKGHEFPVVFLVRPRHAPGVRPRRRRVGEDGPGGLRGSDPGEGSAPRHLHEVQQLPGHPEHRRDLRSPLAVARPVRGGA